MSTLSRIIAAAASPAISSNSPSRKPAAAASASSPCTLLKRAARLYEIRRLPSHQRNVLRRADRTLTDPKQPSHTRVETDIRMNPRIPLLRIAFRAVLLAPLLAPSIAQAQLRSPWDGLSIAATDVPYNCPQPPPFSKTLNVPKATIPTRITPSLTRRKREAEEKATEAPTHLGQWSGEAADAWLTKGSRAARPASTPCSMLPLGLTPGPARCPPAGPLRTEMAARRRLCGVSQGPQQWSR